MRDLEVFALWYCMLAVVFASCMIVKTFAFDMKKTLEKDKEQKQDSKISKVKE